MKEINLKFDLSRARNAEHYQFHSDMLHTISQDFVDKQGIASLRSAYQQLFDTENMCYLQNRSYQDTAAVEAADRKRDDLFLYVAQTITTGKLCPLSAKRQAAEALDYMLTPYRNAPRLNYASNTAAVNDFLEQAGSLKYAPHVKTLGLEEAIAALATANNEFNAIYTERSVENLSRAVSETMKSIRSRVDVAYKEAASAINALYQVNSLIANDSAKEKTIGAVIDQANALIIQLQQTLSRAGVGAKPNFKPGSGTENKPETPGGGDDDRPEIE